MKKYSGWLLAAMVAASMGLLSSCDAAEKLCGPCGTIANGDATISGNAALDGIFKAVGTLKMSTGSINADFNARLKNLAAVFEIDAEGMATADLIAEIKAQFNAQIKAKGELKIDFVEPKCSADISVSASASAQCEAKAGCDVDVSASCDPGELSFVCEGQCSGGCTGVCEGECTAKVDAECSGTCKGSCDLSVEGGGCEGTCKGDCEGTCSLTNTEGECEGECDGTCTGSCKLPEAGASCTGTCKGECKVAVEAECEGTCEGSCNAECSGGCEGKFDPPSCNASVDAECKAEANCSAQAEAQASASLKCTPPSLSIKFEGDLNASAHAEVLAKIEGFKIEMIGMIKGMFELKGLLYGNAELDIEPPVVTIGVAIQDFIELVGSGDFEIEAVGLLPCVVPAFDESADVLINLVGDLEATVSGQLEIFALLEL
jgi:hypothetical protein